MANSDLKVLIYAAGSGAWTSEENLSLRNSPSKRRDRSCCARPITKISRDLHLTVFIRVRGCPHKIDSPAVNVELNSGIN